MVMLILVVWIYLLGVYENLLLVMNAKQPKNPNKQPLGCFDHVLSHIQTSASPNYSRAQFSTSMIGYDQMYIKCTLTTVPHMRYTN